MSDRGAREPAQEVNEPEAIEVADVPEMAPAELVVATVVETPTDDTATTGRGFEEERIAAQRRELAERIGNSPALPPGLRSRLVALAEAGGSIAEVVDAVEESLPDVMRRGTAPVPREHPVGEVFFRGDADAVSEEQAEALARGQLARSGMLRGQRARVAD
jgi:hypothetical protein